MKQATNKTTIIAAGLISIFTLASLPSTFAGVKTGEPVELKFIGSKASQPVFLLNLNNPEAGEYLIALKDQDMNVLYSEKIKGINLSRKYQIAVEEAEFRSPDFGVNVEVTSLKTHKTEVYKIRSSTRVVENILIAKL
ncbi:MAG: hypothetical protein ABIT07_11390 [Ferruginibacter sp.]